jgi:hypothetical protein
MLSFKLERYQALRCSRLVLLAAGQRQAEHLSSLEQARHILSYDLQRVEEAQWNTDEAMNAAIVPNDVVAIVLQEMVGGGR